MPQGARRLVGWGCKGYRCFGLRVSSYLPRYGLLETLLIDVLTLGGSLGCWHNLCDTALAYCLLRCCRTKDTVCIDNDCVLHSPRRLFTCRRFTLRATRAPSPTLPSAPARTAWLLPRLTTKYTGKPAFSHTKSDNEKIILNYDRDITPQCQSRHNPSLE